MEIMERIRRALLSVSDKTGLVNFAQTLATAGIELISTGGTAKTLRDAGLAVTDLSAYTGFPEMLDGRVKTLHPKVHGGILGIRDDAAHQGQMREHGIEPIDLVVVNLYPFRETVARPDVTLDEGPGGRDIGGGGVFTCLPEVLLDRMAHQIGLQGCFALGLDLKPGLLVRGVAYVAHDPAHR